MNANLILTAIALVALLAISAFFSAAETAITSIPKVQLRQLRKSRAKKDRTLAKMLVDQPRMITTFLIGNNIVNILSSSIATAFAIGVAGEEGIGIATAFMTVAIIVFSEITPKTLAARNPIGVAKAIAPVARFAAIILRPFESFFSSINSVFIAIMQRLIPSSSHRLTEDEIRTMVDVGKKEGVLGKDEHGLLSRAFGFTDLSIKEIMTPRTDIIAVPLDAEIDGLVKAFRTHRFSRLPVYDTTVDAIRGMIHYKDLLFAEGADIESLVRPVLFVPETQTTTELLAGMDRSGQNLAIVIDEHGATSGLVSLDDAIGAVFGGIHDEYDTETTEPPELVQVISSGHVRVPGNLKLTDLNALLKTSLDSDFYETVGGFVLEKTEKLPSKGDRIHHKNLVFTVEEITGRRIQRIDIRVEDAQ